MRYDWCVRLHRCVRSPTSVLITVSLVVFVALTNCKKDSAPAEPVRDAGLDASRDAATDASADANTDASCLLDADVGFTHDNCLGCGVPCGDDRPFCCAGTCCADECGSPGNDCFPTPAGDGDADVDADIDVDVDADADGDVDAGADAGCGEDEFVTYENCLGCGVSCYALFPFCCVGSCCENECGSGGACIDHR